MKRVFSVSEARTNFSELVSEAGYAGREVVITRNDRPIAVIIGYKQYLALRQQASERAARFAVYDEIRTRNPEAELEQVEADVAATVRVARTKREA